MLKNHNLLIKEVLKLCYCHCVYLYCLLVFKFILFDSTQSEIQFKMLQRHLLAALLRRHFSVTLILSEVDRLNGHLGLERVGTMQQIKL